MVISGNFAVEYPFYTASRKVADHLAMLSTLSSEMLTGHTIEEENLPGQMFGCAAVTPSYEYEHIPGIDHLTRFCPNELGPKQIGSLAQQLGKEQVLTESFACSGFDATPFELKSIGDAP